MPNWVTQRIRLTGDPQVLAEIRQKHFNDEDTLDFETIQPMPKSLHITKGSATDSGLSLLEKRGRTLEDVSNRAFLFYQPKFVETLDDDLKQLINAVVGRVGCTDQQIEARTLANIALLPFKVDDVIEILKDEEFMRDAQAALSNVEEHGFADWYDWSIYHWGTKWNACHGSFEDSQDDNVLDFRMDTAWSPATSIYEKLSLMYPGVAIESSYIDEGWCFAGSLTMIDGEATEENQYTCEEKDTDFQNLYLEVYGSELEVEDEDQDDENSDDDNTADQAWKETFPQLNNSESNLTN